MRIKVPIQGKKFPPLKVLKIVTDSFVAVSEDLKAEFADGVATGLMHFVDLYGAHVSFHCSNLKSSVNMCATYVRHKKRGYFVIHPPEYSKGEPRLTTIQTSMDSEMDKCWIYNNQFGI